MAHGCHRIAERPQRSGSCDGRAVLWQPDVGRQGSVRAAASCSSLSRFINEHKALGIDFVLPLLPLQTPSGNLRAILFTGTQALLLVAQPGAVNDVPDREIADGDAPVVQLSLQRTQWQ